VLFRRAQPSGISPRAFPSCCATRTFPSCIYFNQRRSNFRAELRTFQSKERVDHASASSFPELCDSDGLRRHPSKYRVSQEYRGTWEQQMACTPDVWRLCGAQVPDADRIVACLRRNTPQLSARCRAVFEQSDNAPRRGERIATTGKGVTIGIMGRSATTGTSGRGVMTTNKTTNKEKDRLHLRCECEVVRPIGASMAFPGKPVVRPTCQCRVLCRFSACRALYL
jgi:hypothetical protein